MISISHAISPTPTPSPKLIPKLYEIVCGDSYLLDDQRQACFKLLQSNPQITLAKDYLTFCKLYLEMIIEKATKGQDYLKSLVNKYPSSHVLQLCATKYYDNLITGCRFGIPHLATDPCGVNWEMFRVFMKDLFTALEDWLRKR